MPITPKQNTVMRGSRPCSQSSVTTPVAAPKPSAVISTPNAALPPSSTSWAKLGPSGIIAPAPIRPKPRPSITPRTSACFDTNCRPSLTSRKVSVQSMRPVLLRSRRGIGRRHTIAADTRNVIASKKSASTSWSTLNDETTLKAPSTVASAGEQREDDRRDRERAVRRGERQRVRRRQLLVRHQVRHRRRLRGAPHQREDLEPERDQQQPTEVLDERQQQEQARRGRCRRTPSPCAGRSGRSSRRRPCRAGSPAARASASPG